MAQKVTQLWANFEKKKRPLKRKLNNSEYLSERASPFCLSPYENF